MVLGVELQQHLQQCRREFEIVDQKVVDGRGVDQLQRSARIAVVPLEVDLLVLGNQLRKALKCLETLVAGFPDIAGGLHFTAPSEDLDKIIGSLADHLEGLVGRRVKRGFLHRCSGV